MVFEWWKSTQQSPRYVPDKFDLKGPFILDPMAPYSTCSSRISTHFCSSYELSKRSFIWLQWKFFAKLMKTLNFDIFWSFWGPKRFVNIHLKLPLINLQTKFHGQQKKLFRKMAKNINFYLFCSLWGSKRAKKNGPKGHNIHNYKSNKFLINIAVHMQA